MRGSVRTRMDVTILAKAGRYELLEELGRGAMGVVYRAQDPVIGRPVAVKTLRLSEEGTGITRPELIARFQTEARAAGLLTHPNIVTIYDAGEEEGLFYITMELVEGRSLQALLDAGQSFPTPRTLRLMEQVCSALEFAHQRNIVHRDIKPANLMLTEDDTVKITDFGTAKILQFGTAQTAHVIGTPSYMSPEQIKGKPVDGRSDIFSLGVSLYELVTGEKPFPGQKITTVIYKIVNEEPIPPRELDSSVPPGLNCVITRALAKGPDARYQSSRELMHALRNYREQGGNSVATVALAPRAAAGAPAAPVAFASTTRRVEAPRSVAAAVEPALKNSNVLVVIVLLALIGGASYRLWPYMRDVWERSRARAAVPSAEPQKPQPGPPAGQLPAAPPATPQEEKPAETKPSEENVPETPPIVPPAAKNPPAHTNSQTPPPSPEATALKSSIEQRLAQVGLADRVHLHAAGNTITLSGRLNPRQHRQLLHELSKAPTSVRMIDHIEYADTAPDDSSADTSSGPEERPKPMPGRGEIEVLTDVLGATAVL